jgi:hypothetical protein
MQLNEFEKNLIMQYTQAKNIDDEGNIKTPEKK